MEQAALPIRLEGVVVHGRQLGRKLGFPTANLSPDRMTGETPPTGVYAAIATLQDQRRFKAMVNVGFRPTVDSQSNQLSVEAHLSGFDGNLYGQIIHLLILCRIRDERRMESLEQLSAQLIEDLQSVNVYITL